ncbi:LamG-like jellyroll fold domain-containing protein [Streptomyces sp. NPDC101118]|uniref:LamG-like jellyroll fold domain-containing protein n=1 Tax=Streptomyces sp. NPDC101118 TaxID=3366109 RepID=UPI0038072E2F
MSERRRRGRGTRGLTAALVLALAGAGAGIGLVVTPRASAVTPPVSFTADSLPTWQTNGIVWALTQVNGTVFAGGTFSELRPPAGAAGTPRTAVNFAALNAATGAPTACRLSFTATSGTATVRSLVVSRDKKTLYAGGRFGAVNGVKVSNVAAIDIAGCTPKPAFHPSFSATVRALAVSDTTLYAAGDFSTVQGQTRRKFAAVNAATGALRAFTANADESGRAVELTPDGKNVLLGGDFFTVNNSSSHALAVADAVSGAVRKTYSSFHRLSVVMDIATDATGFYTGNQGNGGGVFDGRAAFDLDGFGERWRDRCLGATQNVLPYGGALYIASHAHNCATEGEFPDDGKRRYLMAQPTAHKGTVPAPVDGFVPGPRKLGWFPAVNGGIGEGVGPRVMTAASKDGVAYLWVGGEFTTVNTKPQQGLTRYASTGDVGNPTTPVAGAGSVGPGEVQVRWRTSFDADDSRLTYRIYRNGGSTPVHTTTADSLEFERRQASWTDTAVTAGTTYTYRVTATDGAGNTSAKSATASVTVPATTQSYPDRVRADGAQLYWRYDDTVSPYVADSSKAGNTSGLQVGGPALRQAPGAVNGTSTAIGFNGSGQQVYSDHRQTVGSAYSLETWFRTGTTRGGKLIGFGSHTTWNSSQYDKQLYLTDTGRVVFGVYPGSVQVIASPWQEAYNDNQWHHVVATQGPSGTALYVDGKLKATSGVTGHGEFTGYWHVGGDNLAGWPARPSSDAFTGQIDETAVYPKALTAAQVWNHYGLASVS